MTNPSTTIRAKRSDLSPYLFHYTSGFDTLEMILTQMKLIGKLNYICFTEAPLTTSIELFNYFHKFQATTNNPNYRPLYQPYGIGISREFMFELGARPVIYGTIEENKIIPSEFQWKCVELNMTDKDFCWLREWRVKGKRLDFSLCKEEIIVIAPTIDELTYLLGNEEYDIDFNYEPEIGKVIPSIVTTSTRIFKGIAVENVVVKEFKTDNVIKVHINKQIIGETID